MIEQKFCSNVKLQNNVCNVLSFRACHVKNQVMRMDWWASSVVCSNVLRKFM